MTDCNYIMGPELTPALLLTTQLWAALTTTFCSLHVSSQWFKNVLCHSVLYLIWRFFQNQCLPWDITFLYAKWDITFLYAKWFPNCRVYWGCQLQRGFHTCHMHFIGVLTTPSTSFKHLFLCLLLFIVLTTPSTPFLVFRGGRTGPADPTTAGPMRDSIADPLLTCEKPAYHLYRSMLTRTYSLDVKESCGDLRMSRS